MGNVNFFGPGVDGASGRLGEGGGDVRARILLFKEV